MNCKKKNDGSEDVESEQRQERRKLIRLREQVTKQLSNFQPSKPKPDDLNKHLADEQVEQIEAFSDDFDECPAEESTCTNKKNKTQTKLQRPSLIQQFDKMLVKELKKRKIPFSASQSLKSQIPQSTSKVKSSSIKTNASCTSMSEVEKILEDDYLTDFDNADAKRAIDCLWQALSASIFEGALEAAEEASISAPPEFAEEAAAASAREYQTKLFDIIQEEKTGEGLRPVEVVGYIGITKPNDPLCSCPKK